jgi:hypothetical protein
LSQDLRATDDFVKNREALQSLAERGFYPASRKGGELEIFSSEGEATCTTKEGVRYVLRFGNVAGGAPDKGEKTADGKTKSGGLNRYLFVMAQYDDTQIPKPQLEALPGEDQPAAEKSEAKPEDAKPAAEADGEKPKEEKAGEEAAGENVPEQKTSADDEKAAEPASTEEPKAADAPPAAPAEEKAAAPVRPEDEKRIAIEKENKRKQDEYDAAVKKGQDKVKELNDRFADWYFIISDDVYKKIHLGRADIVKKKEKAAADKAPVPTDLKQFEKGLNPTP